MRCDTCKNRIPEKLDFCLNCANKFSIKSFYLAIIPYLVFLYCLIVSGGDTNEAGKGAVWWIMLVYIWTFGVPLMAASINAGKKGLKSEKRIFSYIGLTLSLLPLIVALLVVIIGLIYLLFSNGINKQLMPVIFIFFIISILIIYFIFSHLKEFFAGKNR